MALAMVTRIRRGRGRDGKWADMTGGTKTLDVVKIEQGLRQKGRLKVIAQR